MAGNQQNQGGSTLACIMQLAAQIATQSCECLNKDRQVKGDPMNARSLWSRSLVIVGGLAMLLGALDPLEGCLVILAGLFAATACWAMPGANCARIGSPLPFSLPWALWRLASGSAPLAASAARADIPSGGASCPALPHRLDHGHRGCSSGWSERSPAPCRCLMPAPAGGRSAAPGMIK